MNVESKRKRSNIIEMEREREKEREREGGREGGVLGMPYILLLSSRYPKHTQRQLASWRWRKI